MSSTFTATSSSALSTKDTVSDDQITDTQHQVNIKNNIGYSDTASVTPVITTTKSGGTSVKANANDGTGKIYNAAAGASTNIDMSGVLTDGFGNILSFTSVTSLHIENLTPDCSLTVLPGTTNGWLGPFGSTSDQITIRPAGKLVIDAPDATGYAVTNSSHDILKITAGAEGTSTVVSFAVGVVGRRP